MAVADSLPGGSLADSPVGFQPVKTPLEILFAPVGTADEQPLVEPFPEERFDPAQFEKLVAEREAGWKATEELIERQEIEQKAAIAAQEIRLRDLTEPHYQAQEQWRLSSTWYDPVGKSEDVSNRDDDA